MKALRIVFLCVPLLGAANAKPGGIVYPKLLTVRLWITTIIPDAKQIRSSAPGDLAAQFASEQTGKNRLLKPFLGSTDPIVAVFERDYTTTTQTPEPSYLKKTEYVFNHARGIPVTEGSATFVHYSGGRRTPPADYLQVRLRTPEGPLGVTTRVSFRHSGKIELFPLSQPYLRIDCYWRKPAFVSDCTSAVALVQIDYN